MREQPTARNCSEVTRMTALISVIMPCFNGAAHVRQGIASALQQSHREIELIVVDDGSTDETPEILRSISDPRVRVLTQQNAGVCAARNNGLRAATGDYIAFLDSDDTWHPTCLEMLVSVLKRRSEVALVYCGWQNVGLPGPRGQPFVPPDYERPNKIAALFEGCRWPIHAALVRRETVERAGYFDERYPTSEDFLFWLKIACKNRIYRLPEVLAFYHHHDRPRATDDALRMARNHWLVQREFLKANPDIGRALGARQVRALTDGQLLKNAYTCYWKRDLRAAQQLFRLVAKSGYGTPHDWRYLLPSFLPAGLYSLLIRSIDRSVRKRLNDG